MKGLRLYAFQYAENIPLFINWYYFIAQFLLLLFIGTFTFFPNMLMGNNVVGIYKHMYQMHLLLLTILCPHINFVYGIQDPLPRLS